MRKSSGSIAVFIILTTAWFLQPLQTRCMAADPEQISVEELRSLLDDQPDVIVVDTRSEFSYETGHIPGAISMPFPIGIQSRSNELPRDKTIILY